MKRSGAAVTGMLVLVVGLGMAACGIGNGPTTPGGNPGASGADITLPDADYRVLFVGNSLTYSNDLPGVVQALADAMGISWASATLAQPNWSLQEHWNAGLEAVIRDVAPDLVLLQQGPSTLPENQVHLREWTSRIAPVVREAGGDPALLMVWPSLARFAFFWEVRTSYREAARAVDGYFVPGGETWLRAWEADEDLPFYGADGFHPSYLGTLAVAHTVLTVLADVDPESIPALDDGISPEVLALVRAAVVGSREIAVGPGVE